MLLLKAFDVVLGGTEFQYCSRKKVVYLQPFGLTLFSRKCQINVNSIACSFIHSDVFSWRVSDQNLKHD